MRSSNCFTGDSWTTDSVIKETSASRLRFRSVEQSHQSRLGLLLDREHLAEVGLGSGERGLFGLLRSLVFFQQRFYLSGGRIVIQGLLQSVPVRIWLVKRV